MALSEFSLIKQYFGPMGRGRFPTRLSQGDDAAVLDVPLGKQLVMSVDTLVAGVHFPESISAADIAYKALAVNLSDLAAMGAEPAWCLLSLTLPNFDEVWLELFASSLKDTAEKYTIDLIGGDSCRGPLSITIQVTGLVDTGKFVTRRAAKVGDLIVVSGELGNAALGLAAVQKKLSLPHDLASKCLHALNRPTPRLCLIDFVQKYASAAIDLSDGLIGDLRHILEQSQVGASIQQKALPVNQWIKDNNAFDYALVGGDDYELCLTIPVSHADQIERWNTRNPDCLLKVIGEITTSGYELITETDTTDLTQTLGYQHFGE